MATLTIEDQLAIQQLYARYNHAIDGGKGDAWAACFTADGTFDSASGSFAGTEQLAAFATAFAQRLKARHWITNLVMDAANDGATGSCYLMLLRLGNAEKPTSILTTAIYHDTLKNVGGQWKFSSRKVEADA
ncbi:MAG: nuclear transport factor 2 family protein [Tepidiformaceae bacterium]